MYEKFESSLTSSSGQTVELSNARLASLDSPVYYLSTIIWCVFMKNIKEPIYLGLCKKVDQNLPKLQYF